MRTIATAKVQRNYNCYNVYFNECLHIIILIPFNLKPNFMFQYLEEPKKSFSYFMQDDGDSQHEETVIFQIVRIGAT